MNIAQILHSHTATRPDAAAIIQTRHGCNRTLTFAELECAAARAAALLHHAGLRPGDALLVLYPMSVDLYIALLAIFRLGLVAMFLDASAGIEHIERCCSLHPPKGLIASARAHLLRLRSPSLQRIPAKFSIGMPVPGALPWNLANSLVPYQSIVPCLPETPALLTFTSGSTGPPKAALRTHGYLLAQHQVLEQSLALTSGEVDLTTLPIFLLANLASGVTSIIPDADLRRPGSIHPAPLIAQIRACRPTCTVASPALLECLADYCVCREITLPSFKRIFSGGAPVFPRLLHKLQSIAPHADITAVYGSTEAEPITLVRHHEIAPEDEASMLGGGGLLAGLPVPTLQLRILVDRWSTALRPSSRGEFAAACLPPGQAGEIVVSGAHVLPGYLHGHGDEETKFFVDDVVWHRTGDAGYLDDRGRLWLLGRSAACIEDERGVLYPFSVECIAVHHPGVRRAAILSHRGQRILALEFQPHATNEGPSSLRDALAWAHIDEIRVFKHIPVDKRHNAKIDYPALSELLDTGAGFQP